MSSDTGWAPPHIDLAPMTLSSFMVNRLIAVMPHPETLDDVFVFSVFTTFPFISDVVGEKINLDIAL